MMKNKIDWTQTLLPIITIILVVSQLITKPKETTHLLMEIRNFLGSRFGGFYLSLGLGVFLITIYFAFSKYGRIRLGDEKPQYSNLKWGTMIFTSTMSADIIFYALSEWSMYAKESYIKGLPHGIKTWTLSYSLFHWGPIAWAFYISLAIAFGFMLHVRKRHKQKFSEALRPILKEKTDGFLGRIVDLIAIFAIIAGTATTFSVSLPLLSAIISKLLHIPDNIGISIVILLIIVATYTITVLKGMQAIARLSSIGITLFICLIFYVFFAGGREVYTISNGLISLENMVQHFVSMATISTSKQISDFQQKWTIYYWSYWMVWCTATPFFIGKISKGKTIREVILGSYAFGLSGTGLAFIVLTNYGLGQFVHGDLKVQDLVKQGDSYVQIVLKILETLPFHNIVFVLLVLTMIGLYATVFESITMVVSYYSYQELEADDLPSKKIRSFWAFTFILLPIGMLFMHNSLYGIQSVAIITAFPIGIIILLIIIAFCIDARRFIKEI